MSQTQWMQHENQIISCLKCPRLRKHCETIRAKRKKEFLHWEYWGKPVIGFGDKKAKTWLVGLAPAAHGANRTGRMFTGDSSGNWLYQALYEFGFANQKESKSIDDGLRLKNVYVSSAARCAPPDNKPTKDELKKCSVFLKKEYALLTQLKLIVCLGSIAFDSVLSLLESEGVQIPKPKPKFGHRKEYDLGKVTLLCSYHPSRQNTQTGRLTKAMWDSVFEKIRKSYPA
jgi:uracil-DNA glycosylase family 4